MDPKFEAAVLTLCCKRPTFWLRMGRMLDPECMEIKVAPLILGAVRQISKQQGAPPSSDMVVLQRIASRVAEGKLEAKWVATVSDLFDDAEARGLPAEEDVVAELVPIIKRRLQSAAILQAHDTFAQRGDFAKVENLLEQARTLGEHEGVTGFPLGAAGFGAIVAKKRMGRMSTGIIELDIALGGGPLRQQLTVFIGDSGSGKSQALVSTAAEGIRNGLHGCYATLELSQEESFARVVGNLTGVPVTLILESDVDRVEAERRLGEMLPHIGRLHIGEFAPHATTVQQIVEWVHEKEQETGQKIDFVCVDYGDKLYEPKAKGDNDYLAMRYVFEGMRRDGAVAMNQWWWTASQASRVKDERKLLDLRNVADSMHKVRVADLVITLNPRDEMILYFIAKFRSGKARMQIGPIPHDWDRGRMAPLAREWKVW